MTCQIAVLQLHELGFAFVFVHVVVVCHYAFAVQSALDALPFGISCEPGAKRTSVEHFAVAEASLSMGRVRPGMVDMADFWSWCCSESPSDSVIALLDPRYDISGEVRCTAMNGTQPLRNKARTLSHDSGLWVCAFIASIVLRLLRLLTRNA